MAGGALPGRIDEVLASDPDAFDARVAEEVERLKAAVRDGTFDNSQAIIGLEYEFYGVRDPTVSGSRSDPPSYSLVRVPRLLLELIGFEQELGLHNAEMNTSPQPLNAHGLAAQEAEVKARLTAALAKTRSEGIRLISDGLWTIPPMGETAEEYLTDSVENDGVRIATNMTDAVRYHAMANADYPAQMRIEAPHVTLNADTVMPESLITSIQPHYQVPHAPSLPQHFRHALRLAGPLLALGVNSPLFPADLYDDADPDEVLGEGWMENRIGIFEGVLNPGDGHEKVAFPPDVETVAEAIDRIAFDETVIPTEVEEKGRFDDEFRHLRHKHGSYWRWVRPVFEGETRSSANARVEFRPLPAQPTVRDSVAFLALFAGLMAYFYRHEHPIVDLEWSVARDNFYAAARDGLEADLHWYAEDGERVVDNRELFGELFDYARIGLTTADLSDQQADRFLRPLQWRIDGGQTPARWKVDEVRRRLDEGSSLEEAITGMQSTYIRHQAETLIDGSFPDWH